MLCPRCGSSMTRWRNTFYGVGLAVHEYAHGCDDCGYFRFEAEPEPDLIGPAPATRRESRVRTALKQMLGR